LDVAPPLLVLLLVVLEFRLRYDRSPDALETRCLRELRWLVGVLELVRVWLLVPFRVVVWVLGPGEAEGESVLLLCAKAALPSVRPAHASMVINVLIGFLLASRFRPSPARCAGAPAIAG
jgi:hypothetical protein